jgi:glycosyltransferase involved in cell wall biosynthesis
MHESKLPVSMCSDKMAKIGVALSAGPGGALMVATKLRDYLLNLGHSCDILSIPSSVFRPELMSKRRFSLPFTMANPTLNFLDMRRRNLDRYDVMVPLHPHTLYLNHSNMVVYFLHHYRTAYDLAEWYLKGARGNFPRVMKRTLEIYNRRFLDNLALIRTRSFPFFAISKSVAFRLAKFWNIKVKKVIYPGGYDPSFIDRSRDYVLYFGRLDWNVKRLRLVYAAAKQLPQTPFVIAGDVHATPDWVVNHPSNVKIILRNEQFPHTLKVDIFSRASCLVYPAYEEDYGIVPVEAMSAGKPCIVCSDGGGVLETVLDDETGLVVEPSAEALAKAIQELHGKGEMMKHRCIERAKEFSWTKCLSDLSSEIATALREP